MTISDTSNPLFLIFPNDAMSVEKEKFRLGKCKFQFGSGGGRGPAEEPLVGV